MKPRHSVALLNLIFLALPLSTSAEAKRRGHLVPKDITLPALKLHCESDPDQKLLSGDILQLKPLIPAVFDAEAINALEPSRPLTIYFDASRVNHGESPWTLSRKDLGKNHCELNVDPKALKTLKVDDKVVSYMLKVSTSDEPGCIFAIQQASRGMIWSKPDPRACPSNPAAISGLSCYDPGNLFSARSVQQALSGGQEFIHIDRGCRPPGVQASALAAMSRFRKNLGNPSTKQHTDCSECLTAARENTGVPLPQGQQAPIETIKKEIEDKLDRRSVIKELLKRNPNDPEAVRLLRLEHQEIYEKMLKEHESVPDEQEKATMISAMAEMAKPYKNCGTPPMMPDTFIELIQKATQDPEMKGLQEQITALTPSNPPDPRLGGLIKKLDLLTIQSMGKDESELSGEKLIKFDQEWFDWEGNMRTFMRNCNAH